MTTIWCSDGIAINMIRTGPRDRPPLLFMHAVGLDLTWWDMQIAAFGGEYDVIAFDMPGHGLSGALDHAPSFERLATIAGEVLAQAGSGPAHVVGISVGGMIAQMLALMQPDLVRSLTLVATLCSFPDGVRTALRERARIARIDGMEEIAPLSLERWFPPAFRERRPDVLDRAAKNLLRNDPRIHGAMWDMIADLELAERLEEIDCPTLVVAGSEDPNAPVAAARQIAGLIRRAQLHEIPNAGHFPPVEAPSAFNLLLGGFLSVDGAGQPRGA